MLRVQMYLLILKEISFLINRAVDKLRTSAKRDMPVANSMYRLHFTNNL